MTKMKNLSDEFMAMTHSLTSIPHGTELRSSADVGKMIVKTHKDSNQDSRHAENIIIMVELPSEIAYLVARPVSIAQRIRRSTIFCVLEADYTRESQLGDAAHCLTLVCLRSRCRK
jgi:hypothetical protein